MSRRFAAAVVRLRMAVVGGWIALALTLAFALPTLEEAQTGALGDLVPAGADAITAEERVAELFALPLASRTVIVERDPDGLSAARLEATARRISDVNAGRIPELRDAAGAYGIANSLPALPFARERGTTALTYLLFPLDIGQAGRTARAENLVEALDPPPSSFAGVTGAIPARAAKRMPRTDVKASTSVKSREVDRHLRAAQHRGSRHLDMWCRPAAARGACRRLTASASRLAPRWRPVGRSCRQAP